MGYNQIVYQDFSGGFNDTAPPMSVGDGQLVLADNCVFADESKAIKSRNGNRILNTGGFPDGIKGEITDAYEWLIGTTKKMAVVMNHKVYEFFPSTGTFSSSRLELKNDSDKFYPFVYRNRLFFGDGTTIYEWGGKDWSTDNTKDDVVPGDIVQVTDSKSDLNGKFYQLKDVNGDGKAVSVDFKTEDYTVTDKWTDVTDIPHYCSNVVREIKPYDGSKNEIVQIEFSNMQFKPGTVTAFVDDDIYTHTFSANTNAKTAQLELVAMFKKCDKVSENMEDKNEKWTVTYGTTDEGALYIKLTSKEKKPMHNGSIDWGETESDMIYRTVQEGKTNDCTLDKVKKCTIFCVYLGNNRLYAAGNPDDLGALYYSEIGLPTYFKDSLNVVYPSVNGLGKVTAITNFSGSLLVSYEDGWYAWSGQEAGDDAKWQQLNIPYGCVAPRTVCLTPYSMTFLAKSGVYRVLMSILYYEIALVQTKGVIKNLAESRVENAIKEIDDIEHCEAIFYNDTYYLAYKKKGDTESGRNYILRYEWSTDAWSTITGWHVNRFLQDSERLMFASRNYVIQGDYGLHDVDVDTGKDKGIDFHIITKEYSFGTPMTEKKLQMIALIFKQYDQYDLQADMTLYADDRRKVISINDSLLDESLNYGRIWGRKWGYNNSEIQTAETIVRGVTFQLEIETAKIDNPVTIVGIGFIYRGANFRSPYLEKDDLLLR